MPDLRFTVPGPIVPWQRAASNGGRRFTARPQRAYQRHVAACARTVLLGADWSLHGRYHVVIAVSPPNRRRFDLDNAAKTVLDALNLVAWNDDSQVDRLFVERLPPGEPFVRVSVTQVDVSR